MRRGFKTARGESRMAEYTLPDVITVDLRDGTKLNKVFGDALEVSTETIRGVLPNLLEVGIREHLQDAVREKVMKDPAKAQAAITDILAAWEAGSWTRARTESMMGYVRDVLKRRLKVKAADLKGVKSWDTVEEFLARHGFKGEKLAKAVAALRTAADGERERRKREQPDTDVDLG